MSTDVSATDQQKHSLKQRIKQAHSPVVKQPGKCVVYVMSRDQRVRDNHALLAAQQHALAQQLPLAVVFCLKPSQRHRAREHYQWMLAGFSSLETELRAFNIPFMLLIGDANERLAGLVHHIQPDALYFDMSPFRGQKKLIHSLTKNVECPLFVVDTHNIVPVWRASDKQEFAARTIRPKIHRLLSDYLEEPIHMQKHPHDWHGTVMSLSGLTERIDQLLAEIPNNGQADLLERFSSGEQAAHWALDDFLQHRLARYDEDRNDPTTEALSDLSPYLHYGQLSSLRVVLRVQEVVAVDESLRASADTLIEEMVVRKELSDNYCYYNDHYDSLSGAAEWAQNTLKKHASDEREFLYSFDEFAEAKTHDPAWNAAQIQLLKTGKMHGYMRMYWAKKVLEWSESPDQAIDYLIRLNDFYSIDGGDPNGYVGILWSVAGVHDRPWGERPVYGTIRSMVYGGLKRKFNIEKYIDKYTKQ